MSVRPWTGSTSAMPRSRSPPEPGRRGPSNGSTVPSRHRRREAPPRRRQPQGRGATAYGSKSVCSYWRTDQNSVLPCVGKTRVMRMPRGAIRSCVVALSFPARPSPAVDVKFPGERCFRRFGRRNPCVPSSGVALIVALVKVRPWVPLPRVRPNKPGPCASQSTRRAPVLFRRLAPKAKILKL